MIHLAQIVTFNAFEPQLLIWLAVVVALLCMSALVSGSETAFFSLSPVDISEIKKRDQRSDRNIMGLLEIQDYLLATILIVNNLVNICIVILSSGILDSLMSFNSTVWEFVIKTLLVTFLLLLFGEIMPKVYAAYNPMKLARIVSAGMKFLVRIMKPFAWVLIKSGNVVNEKLSRKRAQISIDDLSDAIEITGDHTEQERQMLSGIVSFVNRDVAEIMVLRMDIVALDIECGFDAVKKIIIDSGFSRIPVYEENIDTIKGILYVKDMTPFIVQSDEFNWQAHLRKPYFVPENKKINDLLDEFQTQKVHIAIVVDEYGATQGLVSLEDILEEIVGEITDESDTSHTTFYEKLDDGTYIFEGKTHLSDFEKVMGLEDNYFGDAETVAETLAGLLLELKHDFLKKGDSIRHGGFRFTVTSLDGRRIDKVKVVITDHQ